MTAAKLDGEGGQLAIVSSCEECLHISLQCLRFLREPLLFDQRADRVSRNF